MKKLINKPGEVAREAIEGLALAYPQYLRQLEGLQAVVRRDAPVRGRVAVLTGGGSGHEPMFAGFAGRGMAHGSVAGNVFTAPSPDFIVETAKAIDGGAGVLFLYGNYSGDVLNFDMAAEMLSAGGMELRTVRIADDVASAPRERRGERRGVAGDFFVIKVAGARSEEGADLNEVAAAAEEANENIGTVGIALSSCTVPESGRPTFEISEDEIEIGMGLHGEPGVRRGRVETADKVAEEIVSRIVDDMALGSGSEAAVLVNGLGATPLAELLIMFRAVHHILSDAGISIVRPYVGNFATSLEMAGCSVSLMRMTPLLARLLSAPAQCPAFVQV